MSSETKPKAAWSCPQLEEQGALERQSGPPGTGFRPGDGGSWSQVQKAQGQVASMVTLSTPGERFSSFLVSSPNLELHGNCLVFSLQHYLSKNSFTRLTPGMS